METSLMSESVVNAGDVEESVTQVLTHFVQGGGELWTFWKVSPVCIYICFEIKTKREAAALCMLENV